MFAHATHLPNVEGGDDFSYSDDNMMQLWRITAQDLNFHTPDDIDFFRLDLPDEAGDDCSSGFADCAAAGVNEISNGLLEITAHGAARIIAYDINGNVVKEDGNNLRYTCPRGFGNDVVYFAVVGSETEWRAYAVSITYSVPDPGAAQKFLDLCNAKRDPYSPDPEDADDSYGFVNPEAREAQRFIHGAPCNPLVCDPPKRDYLIFNWTQPAAFAVEFEHSSDDPFRFQLRDNRLRLVGEGRPSGAAARIAARADSTHRQRIEVSSLAAGLYLLRVDSAQIGSEYSVRFESVVDVERNDSPRRVPAVYALEQNHPNPFNPGTTIRYSLPERSYVTLTVFNTLGQKVGSLVQGEQEAGYHEVRFDASSLSSGVYLYRLAAGSFVQTRRLVVIK
jgi:hypothetical protein